MSSATDITQILARHIVGVTDDDLPAPVRREAAKTFLNWMGCAVGAAHHEAVEIAVRALAPFSAPAQATVLGRSERVNMFDAALFNGISSHVFDFDDTHLKTVIHPAGPVCSAILAYAEYKPVSGRAFVTALATGVDVECRIGNAVYPDHYHVGWHITGTAGVFGAAAAVGKLMNLDAQRMTWALGLAATQPVGLREMFGTMTKSFHPGRAAQNGLLAAILAEGGYTSSDAAIEAKRGWANVLSTHRDYDEIVGELGVRNELMLNSYKPFACGIVIHPAIDACVQLRNAHAVKADDVAAVELKVHPLVLELTGKREPKTGLDGKFSVYHSAAVALIDGRAGEAQYSDAKVKDPQVVRLRDAVAAEIDPAMAPDAVDAVVILRSGERLHMRVDHAIGSVARPMSEADLVAKFDDLVEPVLGAEHGARLREACLSLDDAADAASVARDAALIPRESPPA